MNREKEEIPSGSRGTPAEHGRLVVRLTGFWTMLLGAVFIGMGGLIVWLGFRARDTEGEGAVWAACIIGFVFCLLPGLLLISWRRRVVFDFRSRRWRETRRAFGIGRQRGGSFDELESVVVESTVIRGTRGRKYLRFPVTVVGKEEDLQIEVKSPGDFSAAWRLAARLAVGVGIPVVDLTTPDNTVILPEHVGGAIKKADSGAEEHPWMPRKPKHRLSTSEVTGEGVRFHIPAADRRGIVGAVFVILVIPGMIVLAIFSVEGEIAGKILSAAVFSLPFVAWGCCLLLQGFLAHEDVEVTPEKITLVRRAGPFRRRRVIRAEEVDNVDVRNIELDEPAAVTVVSRRGVLAFAHMVSEKEKRWIAGVTRRILAS